jgi:hypothetical protein
MSATDTDTLETGAEKGSKNLIGHFAAISFQKQKPVWDFLVTENGK